MAVLVAYGYWIACSAIALRWLKEPSVDALWFDTHGMALTVGAALGPHESQAWRESQSPEGGIGDHQRGQWCFEPDNAVALESKFHGDRMGDGNADDVANDDGCRLGLEDRQRSGRRVLKRCRDVHVHQPHRSAPLRGIIQCKDEVLNVDQQVGEVVGEMISYRDGNERQHEAPCEKGERLRPSRPIASPWRCK